MYRSSILLMDVFGVLDASRSGLIEAFVAAGYNVTVANFSYTHLSQSEELGASLFEFIEQSKITFDGAISINAVGLCESAYINVHRRGVAHAAWFIDSPFYFKNLDIPDSVSLSVACSNFRDHPQFRNARWLPFAGTSPQMRRGEAKASIGFLGSIHHIGMYAERSKDGLIGSITGYMPPSSELRDRMRDPIFMLSEEWSTPDGTPISAMDYFNFQSSMHRLENLSYFSHSDIEIQGPENWLKELWTSAPHLLKHFNINFVSGQEQMFDYMNRYQICLNIFHIQNMNGGPNFRSFDAASHYIPCLSQYNADCAEIFPHGEAALYFKNGDDARYLYKELNSSVRLRDKISKRAARTVLEGNTFSHRAKYFTNYLDLKSNPNTDRGTVRQLKWQDGWLEISGAGPELPISSAENSSGSDASKSTGRWKGLFRKKVKV